MYRRSLARLVAAIGLAAAVAVSTAGTASALPPSGADAPSAAQEGAQDPEPEIPDPRTTNPGPPPGGATPSAEQAGPHDAAPTANLRKLANAIGVRHKGLYLQVTAPAGLGVGPVEISIGYGAQRLTRTYSNTNPAEYTVEFPPLTGAARQEYVAITLTERVPGGPFHYTIFKQVEVAALYTVTASTLEFATAGCDALNGEADPTFAWVDPAGVQHRMHASGDRVTVAEFQGTWTGVDVNTGLTSPVITWVDRDPGGITIPRSFSLPRGERLLPFAGSYPNTDTIVQEVQDTLPDIGGDCEAQVRYTLTFDPEGTAL